MSVLDKIILNKKKEIKISKSIKSINLIKKSFFFNKEVIC